MTVDAYLHLLGGQNVHFVVDDTVNAERLEHLDGVLGVVVVAPAEHDQAEIGGQVNLGK